MPKTVTLCVNCTLMSATLPGENTPEVRFDLPAPRWAPLGRCSAHRRSPDVDLRGRMCWPG
ncbi:hypothetical protein B484DRAFT_200275 [Ochromonadaceae sp. CCMP2298]|nr:hypothetical protein B484DRAFT_200275 [Ochromonadaceae sp. CCMP2298]